METLAKHFENIRKVQASAALAARNITLLGACKGQSTDVIENFIGQGLSDFGENRVQEAGGKWLDLKKRHPHVKLHLIGPLQTNKIKDALSLFDVIQTIDRLKLAEAITKELSKPHVTKEFYIQVNTGEEPQKAGVTPNEANVLISESKKLGLNIVGLMCVPPTNDMPAPHFALLKKIADEHGLKKLSMGMSEDYETAIRMGSTCVRIGRALFGERH